MRPSRQPEGARVDCDLGSRPACVGQPDESSASYALEVRPTFDALVGMAAQASAALLAVAAGLRDGSVAAGLIQIALASHGEALDQMRVVRVPATAGHHHRHLQRAAALIGSALSEAQAVCKSRGAGIEGCLSCLRRGWSELNRATAALPGLSVLNLGQCCGAHISSAEGWLTGLVAGGRSLKR